MFSVCCPLLLIIDECLSFESGDKEQGEGAEGEVGQMAGNNKRVRRIVESMSRVKKWQVVSTNCAQLHSLCFVLLIYK